MAPGLRTGLESWASCWKRRLSPCCPAGTSPQAPGPASLGWSSGSGQTPWGQGTRASSSLSRCGSCAPVSPARGGPWLPSPRRGGRPGGLDTLRFTGQPGCEGDGDPNPRSAPVAPCRAQSNNCPHARLPCFGGARPPVPGAAHLPGSACPSAPSLPPAGDAGPGMEAFVFISDWGGCGVAHGAVQECGASCGRAEKRGWVWHTCGKDGPGSASETGWMLQDSTDPSLLFFFFF